jgi:hypothetical protein
MKPLMSDAELELFKCAITGKEHAVEFGSGGSTLCLLDAGVADIFSVESSASWVRRLLNHEDLRAEVASGRLTVYHADIGETKAYGFPANDSRRNDWPGYWREPWRRVDGEKIDLVVVDGRFRVACTLNAIANGIGDETIVIHDFWNRPGYQVLLKYLNCASRTGTLGIFFPKKNIHLAALIEDLERHAYVPD